MDDNAQRWRAWISRLARLMLSYAGKFTVLEQGFMSVADIKINAIWDEDAGVWVATSTDIEGLAIEAPTLEALEPKVLAALSDLIELNGLSKTN